MDNTMIFCDYLNTAASLQIRTTSFWVIMWIVENNPWKPFVYCWLIRSNTRKISSFYVVTMNVPLSIVFMGFTMNVSS